MGGVVDKLWKVHGDAAVALIVGAGNYLARTADPRRPA